MARVRIAVCCSSVLILLMGSAAWAEPNAACSRPNDSAHIGPLLPKGTNNAQGQATAEENERVRALLHDTLQRKLDRDGKLSETLLERIKPRLENKGRE